MTDAHGRLRETSIRLDQEPTCSSTSRHPSFGRQSIRKAHDLGWKPLQLIDNPAASIGIVMRPAGNRGVEGIARRRSF